MRSQVCVCVCVCVRVIVLNTHPARLNNLMLSVQTVLNVHQLLKVILKDKDRPGSEEMQWDAFGRILMRMDMV